MQNLIMKTCLHCLGRQSRQNCWLLIAFTLLHLATTTDSTRMHYIHWNSSNPMFRIDRNDNVIDINGGNHPWEYDQVNIVCPVYKPGTSESEHENYIIYSVSKEEYESCRITQSNPKIIALCNRPYELMYFTITFRSFTPTPGGLEFRPGHNYYFISTSSKGDIHRRVGGSCSSNNMKVVFKVAENSAPDTEVSDLLRTEDSEMSENGISDSNTPQIRPLHPRQYHPFAKAPGYRRNTEFSSRTYYYPSEELSRSQKSEESSLESNNNNNNNKNKESSFSFGFAAAASEEALNNPSASAAMHSSSNALKVLHSALLVITTVMTSLWFRLMQS